MTNLSDFGGSTVRHFCTHPAKSSTVFAPILRSATQVAKAFPLCLLQY